MQAFIFLDKSSVSLNTLPTECHLLIAFAYSLDPDQARQNVSPDLDPITQEAMSLGIVNLSCLL